MDRPDELRTADLYERIPGYLPLPVIARPDVDHQGLAGLVERDPA